MQKKILVIEDEKHLLDNITFFLQAENYKVYACSGGLQGIRVAKQCKPDLIICDIMMPGIDGYRVLKELRENNIISTIPFMFLTAKVERNDIRKGMDLGSDDYLLKPFDSVELINAVKARLNRFEIIKAKNKDNTNVKNSKKFKVGENILFKLHNSAVFMSVNKIMYIISSNQYTLVVIEDNKQILMRRSIKKWESLLPESIFVRIHRSTIVNTNYISKIENVKTKRKVILKNGNKDLEISRRYFRKLHNIRSIITRDTV